MRYARLRRTSAVACALLIGTLAACTGKSGPPDPAPVVNAFLSGWTKGAFDPSVTFVDAKGTAVPAATVATDIKTLEGDLAGTTMTLGTAPPKVSGQTATAVLTVTWAVAPKSTWRYESVLTLTLSGNAWHVVWSPAVVEPHLVDGTSLKLIRTPGTRGSILDASGNPLVQPQPVVAVGIEPSLVTDLPSLTAALQKAFTSVGVTVDMSGLPAQVAAARPTDFVPVATLPRPVYQQIRSQIHDLPGTVFQDGTQQMAPTPVFARALLGTVGDVTKDRMDANPGRYQIGDQVGFGGLEEAYEDRLAGSPGLQVVIPPLPKPSDQTPGATTVLYTVDAVPGQSVATTLDVKTQNAADSALAGEPLPAAIVAMRVSDGAVLAVANGPGAATLDLALTAQVPPGSTFKMVTATNVLESGAETPNSIVNCPATLTVSGRTFTNDDGLVLGNVPLITDFARSCNTAFASLAPKLGANGLTTTAAQLGIGGPWKVGIAAYTGSVPNDGTDVDQAAAAFGQGKTLVSPISMVSAVGAVARGHWISPVLVTTPPVTATPPGAPLKPTTVTNLQQMMRAVVTSGTAQSLAHVPGAPVYAKTGTAEFDANPAHAHSWVVGYRGDLAFAVFVENGGLSTTGAVPLAAKFLTTLGG